VIRLLPEVSLGGRPSQKVAIVDVGNNGWLFLRIIAKRFTLQSENGSRMIVSCHRLTPSRRRRQNT